MDLSNVRIREHFGLVSNDTHTGEFNFLVSPPKNRPSVEKQDYVLIDHPLLGEVCQVLALIKEITSYEEVAGSTIGDKMGKMLATAEILGYIDLRSENRHFSKLLLPPNPGSRVYVPLTKFLEDTLNRNAQGKTFIEPLEIGTFEASSAEQTESAGKIKCFIDAKDLTTRHTLITAIAGAGKTHTAKVIIQELSDKTTTPIVVFDNYGEYSNCQNVKCQIITIDGKTEKENLPKEIKKSHITIFSTKRISPEEKRIFYLNTLKTMLKLRMEEKIQPFFLLIEEAQDLRSEVLDQIVSEGRKIGIFICIITTHPSELGSKILTQIGNLIIGKTFDKEDNEYLTRIANTPVNSLADLAVGEWIICGVNSSRPMKAQIKTIQEV